MPDPRWLVVSLGAVSDASPAPRSVIAVSNQKGGEGKTTTAVNLAASLAAAERRVLLVDLDPQGNASSSVGYPRGQATAGAYELLMEGAALTSLAQPTPLETLKVIPATGDLAGAEVQLVGEDDRVEAARLLRRHRHRPPRLLPVERLDAVGDAHHAVVAPAFVEAEEFGQIREACAAHRRPRLLVGVLGHG